MKSQMIRLYLLLSWGLLLMLGLLSWGMKEPDSVAAYSPPNAGEAMPNAFVHQWDVNEIFSCGDGSEQFVELLNPTSDNFEVAFGGEQLIATNLNATQAHTFTFPSDVSPPTGNKSLLIATNGFSSLPGGVTPDFILPDDFLFPGGGSVKFATFDTFSYGAGQLPLDGVSSLRRQGTSLVIGPNSPKNYTDLSGSVSCPLVINKKGPATANSGSLITYTLTVTSSGTVSNTNVVLTDTVPLSTTFVSASDGISPVSGVLTWTSLGTMPTSGPTSVASRTFVVTANAPIGTVITNANYGVRSDQTSAKGTQVQVSVVSTNTFIYLPIIFKDFTFVDEHSADLPSSK